MSAPLELTANEFVEFVSELDEFPPLVPLDHVCDDGTARIKWAPWVDYAMTGGERCEAIIFDEGLMLVSPALWEVLGG